MTKLKKLYLSLKLYFYNVVLIVEDFINKLSGRKTEHIPLDEAREMRQLNNTKLRAALRKLRQKIYRYDEEKGVYVLEDFAKQKDFDLVSLMNEEPLSTKEKMRVAKAQAKLFKNPTDTSGTEDAMVKHNVKNARRYQLEKERRDLAKQRQQAMKNQNAEHVRELNLKIQNLNAEIQQLKEEK